MTTPRLRPVTLEEFLTLPEKKPALEYANGKVTQKVSPQGKHGRLQSKFAELLNGFGEPRRLAIAFTETRATFAGRSRVPDVTMYRWERIPRDPNGEVANVFRTPPDIAVEILSPEQSVRRQVDRCRWYVANGVQIALVLHPDERSVRLFRADGTEQRLTGADRIDLDAVLPGFELTVEALFGTLRID
jgi:Uma2 family endonuclease